jgi:RNA-directed DNA polymerase
MCCCGVTSVAADRRRDADGPERGRLSPHRGPRVLGCGPLDEKGEGIVPAAQALTTITHQGPQSHTLMPFLGERFLARALREGGRRRSAPGADGVTWAAYRREASARIPELARALKEGTWRPGPLRSVPFDTYAGKHLPGVIPTVEDRIVQRAMRYAVEPILEARAFTDWVSGYRPRRNRITALRHAMFHHAAGYRWVADVDVERVSFGLDAAEVTDWLAAYVHDGTFLDRFRTAVGGMPSPLAPGGGLAPMLINLRLVPADWRLADLRVVRFTDNYCAFTADRASAEQAFTRILEALAAIGLAANTSKSRVRQDACVEDLFLIAG